MAYAVLVLFSFTLPLIIYKHILIRLKKNLQSLPKRVCIFVEYWILDH